MAATLGSQPDDGQVGRPGHFSTGGADAAGVPASRSNTSVRGGLHGMHKGPMPLPMSPPGSKYTSYLPPAALGGAQHPAGIMPLGSADGWKGVSAGVSNRSSAEWSPGSLGPCHLAAGQQQPPLLQHAAYGSMGGDSDMSAATGYTQLSRRFGSMHVASSDSLSDMAFSRNSSHFAGSAHGLNHSGMAPNPGGVGVGPAATPGSSGHSADTEACVRAGQVFSAASFASMAPVGVVAEPTMMCVQNGGGEPTVRHHHTVPCSLLDELDLGEWLDALPPVAAALGCLCQLLRKLTSSIGGKWWTGVPLKPALYPRIACSCCCDLRCTEQHVSALLTRCWCALQRWTRWTRASWRRSWRRARRLSAAAALPMRCCTARTPSTSATPPCPCLQVGPMCKLERDTLSLFISSKCAGSFVRVLWSSWDPADAMLTAAGCLPYRRRAAALPAAQQRLPRGRRRHGGLPRGKRAAASCAAAGQGLA